MIQPVGVNMQPPTVRYQPAPTPLPETWAKAVANDIAERLTRDGWQTTAKLKAWHPTGNPTGHHYHTPGSIPGVLPTTELLSKDIYVWGTIDPRDYTPYNIPPLAYALAQLDLAETVLKRSDARELMTAAQGWLHKCRHPTRDHKTSPHLYRSKPNRHGNPKLARNDYAMPIEAEVFLISAQAAQVVTLDADEYEDALHDPEFKAAAALAIIARSVGYTLQAEGVTLTAS